MITRQYIILVLWILQCEGKREIKEESLIQIAFANEQVNATCKATFPNAKEYTHFKVSYYRIDSKGKEITMIKRHISETILQGMMNQTRGKIYKLPIQPDKHNSVTGTYYCKAEWQNSEVSNGDGTFILFRDKGYEEPPHIAWMSLITFIIILAVLSVMGTTLLFWKREVVWSRSHAKKCPDQEPAAQQASGNLEPPESTYMALKPHQSDIYASIENEASRTTTHRNTPTAEVSGRKAKGEIQDLYENNITEVYENL